MYELHSQASNRKGSGMMFYVRWSADNDSGGKLWFKLKKDADKAYRRLKQENIRCVIGKRSEK